MWMFKVDSPTSRVLWDQLHPSRVLLYAPSIMIQRLCACDDFDRHVRFLKHCPNLQELDLIGIDDHGYENDPSWNEPTMVPGCILSNLQFFSWSNYFGLPDEKNLAAYILRNARGLKTAAFWSNDCCVLKHEMIKELSRASTVCQLSFDGDSY